jgi:hypothetical protein
VVTLGVGGFFDLVERGRGDSTPARLEIVCHHSSAFFRGRIFELLGAGRAAAAGGALVFTTSTP